MEYTKQICKVTDNQIVYPILETENIGNAVSSINYNFNALDVYTCNFEFSASNLWNNIYNLFTSASAEWISAMNTVNANSDCWTDSYNTVKSLSSVWLKPISLIFPYPFESNGETSQIISTVTAWVNEALPIAAGSCYNFIVGQELFIFTPEYKQINQILTQSKISGAKSVNVSVAVNCIGAGTRYVNQVATVDCGTQNLEIQIPDKFVDKFVGLKFVVNGANSTWIYDSSLYS